MNVPFFAKLLGLFLLCFVGVCADTAAQLVTSEQPAGDKVELLRSDSLIGITQPDQVIRRVYNPTFRHNGVLMYCRVAVQNATTNIIEAFGNVRLIQGDTVSVRGDSMTYYGASRQAIMQGNVVLKDRRMTLSTARLDYNMLTGLAYYPTPGRIIDRENTLTSQEGYYDTRTKQFTFIRNVKLVNTKGTLTADTLLYNSITRLATFQGPTRISNKDGVLTSVAGEYNTATGISNFNRRATVETPEYRLTGDSLYYDNNTELGIAKGKVIMVAKDKKAVITGDHVRYNGQKGISRVTGRAVARTVMSDDTLYLRADTLFSFDNHETKTRRLVAQQQVLVFKSDFQSKCDSLIYDTRDSTIQFYKKPIIWGQQRYQLEGDTIRIQLKNNRMQTAYLIGHGFAIALDTVRNFNQMKGRLITAYFNTYSRPVSITAIPTQTTRPTTSTAIRPISTTAIEQETVLERVLVEGNGQSLYAVLDTKNKMTGLNYVECSRMILIFNDKKIQQLRFYGHPDGRLIPPGEIQDEDKELDGFRWRQAEQPTLKQVLWLETPAPPAPPAKKVLKKTATLKPFTKYTVPKSRK